MRRPTVGFLGLMVCAFFSVGLSAQDRIAKGKEVYAANKCKTCHSIEGVGAKKGALDGVGSKLGADEIRQWIVDAPGMAAKTKATRKPVMKSYKLSKDDLDALVAYMACLKKPLK